MSQTDPRVTIYRYMAEWLFDDWVIGHTSVMFEHRHTALVVLAGLCTEQRVAEIATAATTLDPSDPDWYGDALPFKEQISDYLHRFPDSREAKAVHHALAGSIEGVVEFLDVPSIEVLMRAEMACAYAMDPGAVDTVMEMISHCETPAAVREAALLLSVPRPAWLRHLIVDVCAATYGYRRVADPLKEAADALGQRDLEPDVAQVVHRLVLDWATGAEDDELGKGLDLEKIIAIAQVV